MPRPKTGQRADYHSTAPKSVRLPADVLAWYEERARVADVTVHTLMVDALTRYAREGGYVRD